MELQTMVKLSQQQKAKIRGSGRTIPASPMSFEISNATAGIIAEMNGKIEVSDSKIYAGFGGLGNQLHVPRKLSLGTLLARDITDGTLAEGANIDYIFEEVVEALKANDAERHK